MTPKIRPEALQPNNMTPKRGEANTGLAQLEEIASPLGELALLLLEKIATLKELGIHGFQVEVVGSDELGGVITIGSGDKDEPTIRVTGRLGSELSAQRGVPYIASWDGYFYRRPNPDRPLLIEGNHVRVDKGKVVAWGFIDKNTQWGIEAEQSGTIHFIAENEDAVVAGVTVLYYLEADK